jgi:tetratricopeptide (TPR) repeat protein
MTSQIEAQRIRRWQDEVARDPGSLSFLPLADVYRKEGRLAVALRLCIRGLERHPDHVEGHVLLGRIYRELGELEPACDELDIALRLDPEHRSARRALGYMFLERRSWPEAVRHLEIAAEHDRHEPRLASALALARRHLSAQGAPAAPTPHVLQHALDRFARGGKVRLALLMEGSGRILARQGSETGVDLAAMTTLGAGIQSASREMARMLGQPYFQQLYQGEKDRQLFLAPIPTPTGELILVALFGTETNVGLVRVCFDEMLREAAEVGWSSAPASPARDAAAFEAQLAEGLRQQGGGDAAASGGGRSASPPPA